MKTLILSVFIVSICLNKFTIGRESFGTIKILDRIIQQFPEYHLTIHYDNQTSDKLNLIFPQTHQFAQTYQLINYNVECDKKRTNGYNLMNLVFLSDPQRFVEFSSSETNLQIPDIVVFILDDSQNNNKTINELIQLKQINGLQWASSVLVVLPTTHQLYHSCYYCNKKSGKLQLISSTDHNLPDLHNFINRYKDFNGHTFKISYSAIKPYFSCRIIEFRCDPEGLEGLLLKMTSEKLNFRYKLDMLPYPNRNSTIFKISGVMRGEFDWAIGAIPYTIERNQFAAPTRYITKDSYAILYASRSKTFWHTFKNFLIVFDPIAGFVFIITLFVVIVVMRVFLSITQRPASLSTLTIVMIKPLLEQSVDATQLRMFRSRPILALMLLWWLMVLVLSTTYKSEAVKKLINPSSQDPNFLGDLFEDRYRFATFSTDRADVVGRLQSSMDRDYMNVLDRIDGEIKGSPCSIIKRSLHDHIAVIHKQIYNEVEIYNYCKDEIPIDQFARLRLLKTNILTDTYFTWYMRRSTPFLERFGLFFGQMENAGLIKHWYDSVSKFKILKSNERIERQISPIVFSEVCPAFVLLAFGLSSSFLVFVIEIIVWTSNGQI